MGVIHSQNSPGGTNEVRKVGRERERKGGVEGEGKGEGWLGER